MEQHVGKSELLKRLDAAHARIDAILARLSPEQRTEVNTVGAWSIMDLIAHVIAHEQRALNELRHALRGERFEPDYDEDDFNEKAVAASRSLSYEQVKANWDRSFAEVVAAIEALSDADFDPSGNVVQMLGDTIDGAFGNNTYDHYAEHMPTIEALLVRR
jgi:uncharacterized protein (TIGR03083 family)